MLESMTVSQLFDWHAYYKEEPFGFEVEDARHAELCALTLNAPSLRLKKLYTPADFAADAVEAPVRAEAIGPDEIKQKMGMAA